MNWEKDDTFLAKWLSGELSEEDRKSFEESPDGKEFIQMIEASKQLQPPTYDTSAELSKLKISIQQGDQKETKVVRLYPIYKLAIAASVLFLLGLSFFFLNRDQSIETNFLQQEIVALPDGSKVQLNASSTLAYNKNFDEERQLDLDGEAFFEVQKGTKFTVSTNNGAVEVLGTSFNVKSRENRLEVVCYTGKVRVSATHAIKDLLPGDRIVIQKGELINFGKTEVKDIPAWIEGIIELDNVSLNEALIELEANYGIQIEIDESLGNLKYTGSMPKNDLKTALKLVFDPLGLAYTFDENTNLVKVIGQKD